MCFTRKVCENKTERSAPVQYLANQRTQTFSL